MRYGFFEQFDFATTQVECKIEKLSDIPDQLNFNCMLCITLQKFFSQDFDTPQPVIEAMKYNIYDLVTLIREKSYDVFDMPSH